MSLSEQVSGVLFGAPGWTLRRGAEEQTYRVIGEGGGVRLIGPGSWRASVPGENGVSVAHPLPGVRARLEVRVATIDEPAFRASPGYRLAMRWAVVLGVLLALPLIGLGGFELLPTLGMLALLMTCGDQLLVAPMKRIWFECRISDGALVGPSLFVWRTTRRSIRYGVIAEPEFRATPGLFFPPWPETTDAPLSPALEVFPVGQTGRRPIDPTVERWFVRPREWTIAAIVLTPFVAFGLYLLAGLAANR